MSAIQPEKEEDLNPRGVHALFAPDVVQGPDGRFYLYYCLDFLPAIGVAVSDTPAGQYEYLGRVHHADGTALGERAGDLVQFDPGIFIDDDGEIYLYSGNGPVRPEKYDGRHGAQVMSLEPDMLTLKTEPKPLLPSTMESAEKIVIEPDGNIPQVEVTSCGLNGGPMRGTGTYPARICCHLTGKKPAVFSHPVSMKMDYPFLTQDVPDIEPGSEEAIREEVTPVQYIRNMCDGAVAGYKYFSFPGGENEAEALERFVCVTVRGNAHGVFRIRTEEKGESCGEISVSVCSQEWTEFKGRFRTPAGVHGLYFQYDGSGSFDLLSFAME